MLPPSSTSAGKQAQSKRSIFNSCINHLNDLTNINHLRQIQATYDPRQAPETLKLQLLIKAQKSLILDSETTSRDSHAVSKQLYLWSYEQPDRAIQDVGDRLAYLTYQFGDIQSQFSQHLEESRSDLKQIRNLENELVKLRDREKAIQVQISKSQQDERSKKTETAERMNIMKKEHEGISGRIGEIMKELPTEKRKLMKSSFQTQFQAFQELADKLSIISHFGQLLLHELDDDDPSSEYLGKDRTANIKGQAANALAQYKGPSPVSKSSSQMGSINSLEPLPGSSGLHRADTRMFGETHPHILTNVSEVGGVGTVPPPQIQPNTNENGGEPNIRINEVGLEENESTVKKNKPSGSSQPPKLPDRPKVPSTPSSKSNTEFPLDHKIPLPDDDHDQTRQSNVHNDNSNPNDNHSSLQPSHTSESDLPPAYSPTQSPNP